MAFQKESLTFIVKMKNLILLLLIFLISFSCSYHRKLNRIEAIGNSEDLQHCLTQKVDSIIPNIYEITSMICNESKSVYGDTIYLKNAIYSLFDSEDIALIKNCIQNNHKVILTSEETAFPCITINAKYDRCKYILFLGHMQQELAGDGIEYELIKNGNRYQIGKTIDIFRF